MGRTLQAGAIPKKEIAAQRDVFRSCQRAFLRLCPSTLATCGETLLAAVPAWQLRRRFRYAPGET